MIHVSKLSPSEAVPCLRLGHETKNTFVNSSESALFSERLLFHFTVNILLYIFQQLQKCMTFSIICVLNVLLIVLKRVCYPLKTVKQIYIVTCGRWSMNEGRGHGFWRMWSLIAFCVKAMENDSQFGPRRLFTDCGKSFDTVTTC